jgi:hypothetical protein
MYKAYKSCPPEASGLRFRKMEILGCRAGSLQRGRENKQLAGSRVEFQEVLLAQVVKPLIFGEGLHLWAGS